MHLIDTPHELNHYFLLKFGQFILQNDIRVPHPLLYLFLVALKLFADQSCVREVMSGFLYLAHVLFIRVRMVPL